MLREILERIDNTGRPLYAYLLAQQLSESQEGYKGWTKTDLLYRQLERDKVRWEKAFEEQKKKAPTWGDGHPAMKLAVLATIVGQVCFKDEAIKLYFGEIDSLLRKESAAITNSYLINDNNRPQEIFALKPHLLGGWFVLYCFYQGLDSKELLNLAYNYSPNETAIFLQKIAQDFIDFTQLI